jgi:hypothetical protein
MAATVSVARDSQSGNVHISTADGKFSTQPITHTQFKRMFGFVVKKGENHQMELTMKRVKPGA